MEIRKIKAKSILVKSNLPDADYVINPYTGCRFGCTYCYASFMGRFNDKKISDWGEYVFVKGNAAELLRKRLKGIKNKGAGLSVLLSSVTDPYQGVEAKYKITRKCLEAFAEFDFRGKVSILTKSDLVIRDIDVLKKLNDVEVGFTITSTDDKISRYFEKMAPSANQRLKALQKINDAGIKTYAFVGPLLPHYVTQEKKLDKLFASIAKTGTKELYVEHLNLSNYILGRLRKEMKGMNQKIWEKFYKSKNKSYRVELDQIVLKLIRKHGLELRMEDTIYHPEE